jgi:hypothetical protein
MKYCFRTLLIAVALIGFVLAVVRPCHNRYRAIQILEAGGFVDIDNRGMSGAKDGCGGIYDDIEVTNIFSTVRGIMASDIKDTELRFALRHLSEVERITANFDNMTLETAHVIGNLQRLNEISLGKRNAITPEKLEAICRSGTLRSTGFDMPLDDRLFDVLGRSKQLTRFSVHFSNITDYKLRQLIDRPQLDYISCYFKNGEAPREAIESLLRRHPTVHLSCLGRDSKGEKWWYDLRRRHPKSSIHR